MIERDGRTGKPPPSSPRRLFAEGTARVRAARAVRAPDPPRPAAGVAGVSAGDLGCDTPHVRGAPPGHPAHPLRGAIKGATASSKAPWFPPRGSGKSAPLPAFRPPQAEGALSGGPAQLLSRFRRTGKVRLGGTVAPGHAGARGCPEYPASHPPPAPNLTSSCFTVEAQAPGNRASCSVRIYS